MVVLGICNIEPDSASDLGKVYKVGSDCLNKHTYIRYLMIYYCLELMGIIQLRIFYMLHSTLMY